MRRLIISSFFFIMVALSVGGAFWSLAQDSLDPSALLVESGLDPALRIAFVSNRDGNENIYLMNLDGSNQIALTDDPARDWSPVWSPDGRTLAFNSDRDGYSQIYTMTFSGQRQNRLMPASTANDFDPSWSPEGDRIAFISTRSGEGYDIYVANRDGSNVRRLTPDNQLKGHPVWSPDGSEIAYWVRRADRTIQIMKVNITSLETMLLSNAGRANGWPQWSPDGTEIYFDSDRDYIWYVYAMSATGNYPRRISRANVNSGRVDWSPDGNWLLVTTDRDQSDEIYIMRPDGTNERRLTNNSASDHSAVWQPQVPVDDVIEIAVPESDDEAETNFFNPAFGQGMYARTTIPWGKEQLLLDTNAALWHSNNWLGDDVRIGVIDLDFGGLSQFETDFEVEVNVPTQGALTMAQVINEMSANLNPHGTQVLEVIHTLAPSAELYACEYNDFSALDTCTDWMLNNGVRIINHSAGVPVLPLDGNNDWARLASSAVQRGVLWINSSGNFAGGFINETFNDRDNNGLHELGGQGTGITTSSLELIRFDDVDQANPYRGNIILSWDDPSGVTPVLDDAGRPAPPPAFEIEVVDLARGTTLSVVHPPRGSRLVSRFDRVYHESTAPFGVRVRNIGGAFRGSLRFVLFIEFAQLDGGDQRGSVIAPGDSKEVLTVGAVQADNIIAPYSSRGLLDANYSKPDLSAPGAVNLSTGTFIGTSASAPVVAGAAALMLEANPALTPGALRNQLQAASQRVPGEEITYGQGILRMPPPERARLTADEQRLTQDVPPKIIFPQPAPPTPTPVPACAGAMPMRLQVGEDGYVMFNLGLFMRAIPNTSGRQLATHYLGARFTVLEAPVCADSQRWYFVEMEDESRGYLAEGSNYYLLAPVQLDQAAHPVGRSESCRFAPTSQLSIGDTAIINNAPRGGLTIWRRTQGRDVIAGLSGGTELYILGGPICEGDSGEIIRWYVRVMSGNRAGIEGWISEARPGSRWLVEAE